MKQVFFSLFLTLISGSISAHYNNNLVLAEQWDQQKDSVTSLVNIKESYKLSGKNLTASVAMIRIGSLQPVDRQMAILQHAHFLMGGCSRLKTLTSRVTGP